jgi:ATP-dependent Clp protease ATP-binding subunit ClpA
MKMQNFPARENTIRLNPELSNAQVVEFENRLQHKVVGQERAVHKIAQVYQVYLASLASPTKPLGNLLFLGPTGSGKTHLVESAAEILFENPLAFLKVDCAEFQHTHEISKLIGSPPGYLGHRETPPALSQENLNRYRTKQNDFSLVLFDEIEKASDSLWQLLLGILDKATLTLGDNRRVDFSRTIIFMTSNLGAREMSHLVQGSVGFAPPATRNTDHNDDKEKGELDQKIYRTALEATKRKFSPEFMNRIDSVLVFHSLSETHYQKILELELNSIQERILQSSSQKFFFRCSDEAKDIFLRQGIHPTYGARNLKRVLEQKLVVPIANLLATGQVNTGDFLTVGYDRTQQELIFSKHERAIESIGLSESGSRPWISNAVLAPSHDTAVAA